MNQKNVASLTDWCDGISPAIRGATERMRAQVEAAINDALNSGVPVGLVIGMLELCKIDAVNNIE